MKTHCKKLDNIILKSLLDPKTIIVITDASNKNNVASSIVYIYFFNNLLKKMLYHTINIMSTEAELF